MRNDPAAAQERRADIAIWDFPTELGPRALHLLPPGPGAPGRNKRHLDTKTRDGRLDVTVAGGDPYFVWQFELPVEAFGVHVELDSSGDGPLQLFYSTPRCPVFSEPCSETIPISRGRQVIEFLLDRHDPLRELRLDLPDKMGFSLSIEHLDVLREAEFGQAWVPNRDVASMVETAAGLYVDADHSDPWLTAFVPGLDPSRVTAAELTLRGPAGTTPQLYWAHAPGAFVESSSAFFEPVDAGAEVTHRVELKGRPGWKGQLCELRLDPGAAAGRYLIERLALVHEPPASAR